MARFPFQRLHDTHAHPLDDPDLDLGALDATGVRVHAMTVTPEQFVEAQHRLSTHPNFHPCLGLFPLEIDEEGRRCRDFLERLPACSFIGEVGLDFSIEGEVRARQVRFLSTVLEHGRDGRFRTLSLHSRRAGAEVLELTAEFQDGACIFHWYSGPSPPWSKLPPERFFSINTAMLSSRRGKSLIEEMPKERVLLESDGPYVQTGGRPARPTDTRAVVEALCHRWEMPLDEVLDLLEANLKRALGEQSSA